MISRWMRAAWLLALTPVAALAFETVDGIPWPSAGGFPAYGAEGLRPWSVWAQAGAMYDDNVLRLSSGERSDTILRYGAGVRSETRVYGRQRVVLEGSAEYYDYDKFGVLDHFAYAVRGDWLWEIGNELAGTLGYGRRKRLADIGELQRAVRDLITEDRFYATAGYRFFADWRLTGGAEYDHAQHSGRALADAEGNTLRAGIEHVSPLGNAIGLEVRRSQGDAPVAEELGLGTFPGNEFEEREIAATLSYRLGPQLRVGGRVGRTERSYTLIEGRDFNGATGRGVIEWVPGPKTVLVLEAYRVPAAVLDTDALHVVRRGVSFGPNWAPTIKLVFSARLVNERRIFQGDPSVELAGAPLRDETLRFVRLGVGWEPERRWQVGGAIDHGERESNALGRDYKFTALVLNLRFVY
jgi:hypothetical protein